MNDIFAALFSRLVLKLSLIGVVHNNDVKKKKQANTNKCLPAVVGRFLLRLL